MTTRARLAIIATACVIVSVGSPGARAAVAQGWASQWTTRAATGSPTLIGITAAHHPGFDRLVFRFAGSVPARRNVRYVARLLADPSGSPIRVSGRAILAVSFSPAIAHNNAGKSTAPRRVAFALPDVMSVVRAGDFEGVVSYGIGLAKRSSFHVFVLTGPSRIVIDITTLAARGVAPVRN